MKFIKEILGVHYNATNAACRAELGRLPLKSKVQTAAIHFGEHIITSQSSLVNKIYSLTEQSNLWVKKVKKITSVLGYSFINSDPVNMIPLYQKVYNNGYMTLHYKNKILQYSIVLNKTFTKTNTQFKHVHSM